MEQVCLAQLHPSADELVTQIDTINHSWKIARESWGPDSPLAESFRAAKTRLQLRLLREYPALVELMRDQAIEGIDVYSIRLKTPVGQRYDAAHIPVADVHSRLTDDELTGLLARGEE